jgi:hypothetical protein
MKTSLKTKITLTALFLGITLYTHAQDNARKGWDGVVKGKITKVDSETQSENLSTKYSGLEIKSPENNAELGTDQSPTFRWTPILPRPQVSITYRLKVWQLMQGQNGTQAMRSNQPIIEKEVINLTQYTTSIYTGPCKPPYLCNFVWNIQAIDKNGNILINSDPSQFSYKKESNGSAELQGQTHENALYKAK